MSDLTSKELLPCPFCGGEAAANQVRYHDKMIREQEWSQDTFHGVNCVLCGVNNLGLVGHRTPEKAAERWNTRLAHEPDADPLRGMTSVQALEYLADEFCTGVDVKINATLFKAGVNLGTVLRAMRRHASFPAGTASTKEAGQ
jgi:hypothetical protein